MLQAGVIVEEVAIEEVAIETEVATVEALRSRTTAVLAMGRLRPAQGTMSQMPTSSRPRPSRQGAMIRGAGQGEGRHAPKRHAKETGPALAAATPTLLSGLPSGLATWYCMLV